MTTAAQTIEAVLDPFLADKWQPKITLSAPLHPDVVTFIGSPPQGLQLISGMLRMQEILDHMEATKVSRPVRQAHRQALRDLTIEAHRYVAEQMNVLAELHERVFLARAVMEPRDTKELAAIHELYARLEATKWPQITLSRRKKEDEEPIPLMVLSADYGVREMLGTAKHLLLRRHNYNAFVWLMAVQAFENTRQTFDMFAHHLARVDREKPASELMTADQAKQVQNYALEKDYIHDPRSPNRILDIRFFAHWMNNHAIAVCGERDSTAMLAAYLGADEKRKNKLGSKFPDVNYPDHYKYIEMSSGLDDRIVLDTTF